MSLQEVPGLASVVAGAVLPVPPCGRLCVPSALGPSGEAGEPHTKAIGGVCGSGDRWLPPAPEGRTGRSQYLCGLWRSWTDPAGHRVRDQPGAPQWMQGPGAC